jgi:hypothetical protein
MPDFTVIEGEDDPKYRYRLQAQYKMEEFAIFLLRSIVSGSASVREVRLFFELVDTLREHELPVLPVMDSAAGRLHSLAFPAPNGYRTERTELLRAAVMVLADAMSTDDAAKARKSKREMDFERALRAYLLEHDQRCRESGWSYLENLFKESKREEALRKKGAHL